MSQSNNEGSGSVPLTPVGSGPSGETGAAPTTTNTSATPTTQNNATPTTQPTLNKPTPGRAGGKKTSKKSSADKLKDLLLKPKPADVEKKKPTPGGNAHVAALEEGAAQFENTVNAFRRLAWDKNLKSLLGLALGALSDGVQKAYDYAKGPEGPDPHSTANPYGGAAAREKMLAEQAAGAGDQVTMHPLPQANNEIQDVAPNPLAASEAVETNLAPEANVENNLENEHKDVQSLDDFIKELEEDPEALNDFAEELHQNPKLLNTFTEALKNSPEAMLGFVRIGTRLQNLAQKVDLQQPKEVDLSQSKKQLHMTSVADTQNNSSSLAHLTDTSKTKQTDAAHTKQDNSNNDGHPAPEEKTTTDDSNSPAHGPH